MKKLSAKEKQAFLNKMTEIGGTCDNPRLFSKLILGSIKETDGVKDALQNVIDRLINVGYTKKEIEESWNKMCVARINNIGYKIAYTVEWWEGLKIKREPLNAELAIQHLFFSNLWEITKVGHKSVFEPLQSHRVIYAALVKKMTRLLKETRYEWIKEEGAEIFRERLVYVLSCGTIGLANFAIMEWGEEFGLFEKNPHWAPKERYSIYTMQKVIEEAIEVAEKRKQFGVACALAEQVGRIADADRLRVKARELNQKIALDFYYNLELDD